MHNWTWEHSCREQAIKHFGMLHKHMSKQELGIQYGAIQMKKLWEKTLTTTTHAITKLHNKGFIS